MGVKLGGIFYHSCMECEPEGSSHNSQELAIYTTIDHCSSTTCVILGFACLRTSKQHNTQMPPALILQFTQMDWELDWNHNGKKEGRKEGRRRIYSIPRVKDFPFILFLGLRREHWVSKIWG